MIVPSLHFLWSGGWLFGLVGGLAGYWLLMKNDTSVIDERTYESITKVEASPREEPAPWVADPAAQMSGARCELARSLSARTGPAKPLECQARRTPHIRNVDEAFE